MQTKARDVPLMQGRRCTVIGAGGFIGTNLCLALERAGVLVTGCGRSSVPKSRLAEKIRWIKVDVADAEGIRAAIKGADYVVHLVSTMLPAASNHDPLRDVEENLCTTLRLLQICRDEGVRKIIFASSGGTVYGPQMQIPISERVLPNPICSYGIVKVAVESYLELYRHMYSLDYVALRIANPFGPHQYPHEQGLISALFSRALKGQTIDIWGDGSVVRDYLFIDDLVDAMIAAMNQDGLAPQRVLNIGSGVGRSVNDVLRSIEIVHGASLDVRYSPQRLVDVPANVLDIELAKRNLGWSPGTDWMLALERTYMWLRNACH